MSIANLLFHRVDYKRPNLEKDSTNTQFHVSDDLVKRDMPCCIQPATATEVEFYLSRSQEISHTIYTDSIADFQRNERLIWGSRKFYIVGVRNLIELDRVIALDVLEYQGADRRE